MWADVNLGGLAKACNKFSRKFCGAFFFFPPSNYLKNTKLFNKSQQVVLQKVSFEPLDIIVNANFSSHLMAV